MSDKRFTRELPPKPSLIQACRKSLNYSSNTLTRSKPIPQPSGFYYQSAITSNAIPFLNVDCFWCAINIGLKTHYFPILFTLKEESTPLLSITIQNKRLLSLADVWNQDNRLIMTRSSSEEGIPL